MAHFSTTAGYIESLLENITDIGHVHIEDVAAKFKLDVSNLFNYTLTAGAATGQDVFRVWFIDRVAMEDVLETASQTWSRETWTVTGYYGWTGIKTDDEAASTASSKVIFQDHLDDVKAQFFENLGFYGSFGGKRVFNNLAPGTSPRTAITKFKIGQFFCWRAVITFTGDIDNTF